MLYYNPVQIYFDVHIDDMLKTLPPCVLVTSKGFVKRGVVENIKRIMQKKLLGIIDTIAPNPEFKDLNNLKNDLFSQSIAPKALVAFGGGSVIDAAKFFSFHNKDNYLPIYAVPTTHGTSSELTSWATIWEKEKMIKHSLSHVSLYPKVAFYDIDIMMSLPREYSVYTTLDALSHALESIWNKNANPISTNHALKALNLICDYLVLLINSPDSVELRKKIVLASIFAGLAFSQTQTALAHAISYPITMRFNIPHGLACSFTLPLLLECIDDKSTQNLLAPFKQKIKELFRSLHISQNPQDYGLDKEFIDEIFLNLNERAKNGLFNIQKVKQKILNNDLIY